MTDITLAGFIAHLEQMAVAVHHETEKALKKVAVVVETEAKKEIGHYQGAAGQFGAWPQLAEATKADRIAHGFTENDPLLRTGEMRDSIHHKVEMTGIASGVAHVGSDSEIALFQEIGTRSIPPRSFLGGGLFRKLSQVKAICGHHAVAALTGHSVASQIVQSKD